MLAKNTSSKQQQFENETRSVVLVRDKSLYPSLVQGRADLSFSDVTSESVVGLGFVLVSCFKKDFLTIALWIEILENNYFTFLSRKIYTLSSSMNTKSSACNRSELGSEHAPSLCSIPCLPFHSIVRASILVITITAILRLPPFFYSFFLFYYGTF